MIKFIEPKVMKTAIALIAACSLHLFSAQPARADVKPEVVLKAVTPINPNSYISQPIYIFKNFVEDLTDGRVKVDIKGGVEVVPSENQFEALQNGVLDVIVGMTSYYKNVVPEAMILMYTQQTPAQQRASGLYKALADAHDKKGNVFYYANAGGGGETGAFRYYLKRKTDKADFARQKIRVSNSLKAATSALQATATYLPFSDLYLGLQRGLVDGFGTTYAGITADKLDEVVSFVLDEPFYSLNDVILINKNSWNSMPEDLRNMISQNVEKYELMVSEYNKKIMEEEDSLLASKGMSFITFEGEEKKKFHDTVISAGWEQFLSENPENGQTFKDLSE